MDVRPEIFRFAADHSLSSIGLKQEEHSFEKFFGIDKIGKLIVKLEDLKIVKLNEGIRSLFRD